MHRLKTRRCTTRTFSLFSAWFQLVLHRAVDACPVRRVLRLGPLALYGAAASWVWSRDGVPVLDDRMLPWLLGLILALSFTDLRRLARGLLVDWLPFIAALTAYDLLRGIADGRLLP